MWKVNAPFSWYIEIGFCFHLLDAHRDVQFPNAKWTFSAIHSHIVSVSRELFICVWVSECMLLLPWCFVVIALHYLWPIICQMLFTHYIIPFKVWSILANVNWNLKMEMIVRPTCQNWPFFCSNSIFLLFSFHLNLNTPNKYHYHNYSFI